METLDVNALLTVGGIAAAVTLFMQVIGKRVVDYLVDQNHRGYGLLVNAITFLVALLGTILASVALGMFDLVSIINAVLIALSGAAVATGIYEVGSNIAGTLLSRT